VRPRYLFRDIGLNAAPWAVWPADIIRASGLPICSLVGQIVNRRVAHLWRQRAEQMPNSLLFC